MSAFGANFWDCRPYGRHPDYAGFGVGYLDISAAEYDIAWAPASRRLVYGSARDDARDLYECDFGSGKEKRFPTMYLG